MAAIPTDVRGMVRVSGMASPRTQFTRTPAGANSAASERLMNSIAPHVAVSAAIQGTGEPLIEADRVTIEPLPCLSI